MRTTIIGTAKEVLGLQNKRNPRRINTWNEALSRSNIQQKNQIHCK
jgi:hypothetical protein